MRLLTVNAGSTSVKFETYALEPGAPAPLDDAPIPVFARSYAPTDAETHIPALVAGEDVVVHRVVAVPPSWGAVNVFDEAAAEQVLASAGTAPLHDALALRLREAIARAAPLALQLAVADGTFHRTLAAAAFTYAIPRAWTRFGLRRRGYHGLSHEYAAHRGARLIGRDVRELRIATLHLGGGSSLCAVRHGASIDTTMGLTPLDGVPMATRSGAVDPGILLSVLRGGTSAASLERILERESGLLGISGRSGDVRVLRTAAPTDADAQLALDVLAWRVRTALGAIVAALGRVDLIVFTGGIGEHVASVREAAIAGLEGHGVRLDPAANGDDAGEGRLDAPDSSAAVAIVTARENWQLARAGLGFTAREGVVQEAVDVLERA